MTRAEPEPESARSNPVPVIAVASGKGGVGKTTVAVNLALALQGRGLTAGLVDADLYGPDAAHMLGLRRRSSARHLTLFSKPGTASSRLEVARQHGVQVASAALLMGESQGLGVQAGIAQLLVRRLIADAAWEDLDCMVVDLPPGSADIQQFVFALAGRPVHVLLVVTPQIVAHRDAHRLLAELGRHGAAVAGGVANMASLTCPDCGASSDMFVPAPPEESIWARVPLLASIPFSARAAHDADNGLPVLVTRAVPEQVRAYDGLAARVADLIGPPAGPAPG
jgi:ATP-binding protein involved in chromosome partitioning